MYQRTRAHACMHACPFRVVCTFACQANLRFGFGLALFHVPCCAKAAVHLHIICHSGGPKRSVAAPRAWWRKDSNYQCCEHAMTAPIKMEGSSSIFDSPTAASVWKHAQSMRGIGACCACRGLGGPGSNQLEGKTQSGKVGGTTVLRTTKGISRHEEEDPFCHPIMLLLTGGNGRFRGQRFPMRRETAEPCCLACGRGSTLVLANAQRSRVICPSTLIETTNL